VFVFFYQYNLWLLEPEILTLRRGMWEKVSSRQHKPLKIFPFGSSTDEVMIYGTVDYGLKDGRQASVDWAARAHLVKEDDAVKMDSYQVYLVSSSDFLVSRDIHGKSIICIGEQ